VGQVGEKNAVETSPRSRPLVLVIEDEGDIAHLIARTLTAAKYDFLITTRGADAMRHAIEASPDVITLDIQLQDLDGRDVLRRLQEHPSTRDIPVVIVSVLGDEDDPFVKSAFARLSKPIDRAALRDAVARAISSRTGR
jgi:CheY-like chemotaxis protein